MIFDSLTIEQKIFALHPNEAFVEACPGAGKTRTVLARLEHLVQSMPPRCGIAILSFTNSAIEEFIDRSGKLGLSYSLKFPSFVGTFDSFVRHFLFLPIGISGNSVKPQVLDSWTSLNIEICLRGTNAFRGKGATLDIFDPETGLVDLLAISRKDGALKQHIKAHKVEYENAAKTRRAALNRLGYFSMAEARVVALRNLRNPQLESFVGKAIAGRFLEIIVDEAQDCNPHDLEILKWLRDHGMRVTLVCDLDQSIYGFRDGDRSDLETFANTYSTENRIKLKGNFRNSPVVCSLAASLRAETETDSSLGHSKNCIHPIAIFPFTGKTITSDIGQRFQTHAFSKGIQHSEIILLAHAEKNARHAAGGSHEELKGTTKIELLAKTVGVFWDPNTSKSKKDYSLISIEKLLLDLTGQRLEDELPVSTVARLGLNRRVLRRHAFELVMKLPTTCADTDAARICWIATARSIIERLGLTLPQGQTVSKFLRKPPGEEWIRHLQHTNSQPNVLKYATIHHAKGREYNAVCVVIPPDQTSSLQSKELFDSWSQRTAHEPKRVIYVGVTRAQYLVALAIPASFVEQYSQLAAAANIPYEIIYPANV